MLFRLGSSQGFLLVIGVLNYLLTFFPPVRKE